MQVKIRLLGNSFTLIICGDSCGSDDITAAERQNRALIDRSVDGVLHQVQRHGGIHSDVLGAGLVRGQHLPGGRGLIVGEGLLSADGILTGYGNRINIIVNNGFHAEGAGGDGSVLPYPRLCRGIHIGHGEGCTHAYTLAQHLAANLVLDGKAVVGGGGGSGGVDLVGRLRIHFQNTGQLHLVLGAGSFQSGEDGLGIRIEDRQGKAARHAHVGGTCAGDSGSADAVTNIFQFTGIAVFGGKLGNGGFQKQIHTDCGHHLLFFQFLTDPGNGGLILQQGFYQEAWVKEQVCKILEQTFCQRHCPCGDGTQRIALQIGEHDLEDHILHLLCIGKLFIVTVLFDVLIQELLLLFIGKVVQQGVFILLAIQKRFLENVSAGIGARKVV